MVKNLIFGVCFLLISCQDVAAWQELKDKHFIVYYESEKDLSLANRVLREAEENYRKVGSQIGYLRYSNFWTWDQRVKIFIFSDQAGFVEATGQPFWSTGYSDRESKFFNAKTIVTYKQEPKIFSGLLPHEISHLVLRDFVGRWEKIPTWFDEGVAQLSEEGRSAMANRLMPVMVKKSSFFPIQVLMNWDVRVQADSNQVMIYYLQSLSIVEFLIKKYGSSDFGRLCRALKTHSSFEESLKEAYPTQIRSISELEQKWIQYILSLK